ncbi:MAG TPA: universal stress protein [Mycobacteriales bacterium]|nr:universal stress protein [Mycobacteriales bacterium]
MHPQTTRRVVVGVDGAPRTVAALRWAASEAMQRDAELVAVHAWGTVLRPASYAPVNDCADPDESARQAKALLSTALRQAFGTAPPVPVREVVDDRSVVPALLSQARRAELLVIATRAPDGRPFEAGPGSTTLSCLRQAPCPVVILPTVGDRVRASVSWTAGDERPPTLV